METSNGNVVSTTIEEEYL